MRKYIHTSILREYHIPSRSVISGGGILGRWISCDFDNTGDGTEAVPSLNIEAKVYEFSRNTFNDTLNIAIVTAKANGHALDTTRNKTKWGSGSRESGTAGAVNCGHCGYCPGYS
jgi:hypothetical protein